jgi:hypothetical protein
MTTPPLHSRNEQTAVRGGVLRQSDANGTHQPNCEYGSREGPYLLSRALGSGQAWMACPSTRATAFP